MTTPCNLPKKPFRLSGKERRIRSPLNQLRNLQRLIAIAAEKAETSPGNLASLAKAWLDLQDRKMSVRYPLTGGKGPLLKPDDKAKEWTEPTPEPKPEPSPVLEQPKPEPSAQPVLDQDQEQDEAQE